MLKKIFYIFFVFLFSLPVCANENVQKKEEIVHIYYMHEIQPTLMMCADILKRPRDELKLVFNFNIPKDNALRIVPMKMKLESDTQIQNGILYNAEDFNEFKKIYKQHKKAKFIIHTGFFMSFNRLIPFLRYIPKDKIKEIHFYESNVGRIKGHWSLSDFVFDKDELESCIDRHCIKHSDLLFSLGFLYPVTYHMGFIDELKKDPKNADFWKNILNTKSTFEDMDFYKTAENLTLVEKNKILNWYHFDLEAYKAEIEGKKIHMFTVGHTSEKKEKTKILNSINQWYNHYKDDENAIFFIKWGRNKELKRTFDAQNKLPIKTFPDVTFELLILTNLVPDKVSGTPSSLYIHLPKEKIGQIYNVFKTDHIDVLLDQKKITQDQLIKL